MGQPAPPMEEPAPRRSGASRSRSRSGRHSARHHTRPLFFGAAALWGFVLGAGFLAAGTVQTSQPVQWNGRIVAIVVPGAFLAVCSGVALSHLYRIWRERK